MALFDAQISVLGNQNLNYLVSGMPPVQMGNAHMNIAPYEVLPVKDGHIILAVGNDGQFRKFCAVVGLDDLPADPDFATNAARVANREALREALIARLAGFERDAAAGASWRRPACRPARSTLSARCSPTRRPSRAACGSTSTTATATRCPRCARRC